MSNIPLQASRFRHLETLAMSIVTAWFLFQAVYFSVRVLPGIPPDEMHHINVAGFYAEASGISIQESERTYPYGSLNTTPYLYHLAIGKALALNVFGLEPWRFMRSINVLLSFSAFIAIWLLVREVTTDSFARILTLIIIADIPMLNLMSGAVSYDNAIFLLAALFQLAVVRFIKKASLKNALSAMLVVLIGSLIKITMLPFIAPLAVVFIWQWRSILAILKNLKAEIKNSIWVKLLLLTSLASAIACIFLYVGNEIKFGWAHPPASVVLGDEIVYKYYAQHRRDVDFIATAAERPLLSIPDFIPEFFTRAVDNTLGIMAHASVSRPPGYIAPYKKCMLPVLLGLLSPLAIFLYRRRDSNSTAVIALISLNLVLLASKLYERCILPLFIALSALIAAWIERSRNSKSFSAVIFLGANFVFYAAVVMFDNYYSTYINSHILGQAIQGRYLLPAFPGMACIISILSFCWLPKNMPLALVARLLLLEGLAYLYVRHGFFDVQPLMGVNFFGS